MRISTINPYSGHLLKEFLPFTKAEIEFKLSLAWGAYEIGIQKLSQTQIERAESLNRLAALLEEQKNELGRLIVLEMGKTLKSAVQEIEKCALNCRFYREQGLLALAPQPVKLPSYSQFNAETQIQPLGVVLAIMPWNFPFWQVLRCAPPILLSGNSVLLKHASNVPQCALAIEKLFLEAGFPVGAFQTLLIGSDSVPALIQDSRIQGVTLTGSENAGKQVASQAGAAIKKAVMELGGSDPFIVMASANLKAAAEAAVKARLICNGQSCIAAKRFIIHDKIYADFKTIFVEKMNAQKMGDPLKEDTDLGPLVSTAARDELHELVIDAVKAGAKLLCGGVIPHGLGSFYPATVLENIPEHARMRHEEVFGPVAALYSVSNLEAAIGLANSTRFGLGCSFWSELESEQKEAALKVQAGSVFINALFASDPHLPFGGVKASGFGRELGMIGLHEFTNLKTIATAIKT